MLLTRKTPYHRTFLATLFALDAVVAAGSTALLLHTGLLPTAEAVLTGCLGGCVAGFAAAALHMRLGERRSRRRAIEASFRAVLEASHDAILVIDKHGVVELVNRETERLFGYCKEEVVGYSIERLIPDRHRDQKATGNPVSGRNLIRSLAAREEPVGETSAGEEVPIQVSLRPIEFGELMVVTIRDMSERKQTEAEIQRIAMEDALTGLPNRAQFRTRLDEAIEQAKRTNRLVGLMVLDLDDFKNVNDTIGHPAGDELLKQVSQRLVGAVRKTDTIARLGGDEFAAIVTNAAEPDGIFQLAQRIVRRISEPYQLADGKEVRSGTSIGMTIYPHDDGDHDQLLRHADLALYRAKENGRGTVQLYDEPMNAEVQERRALEEDLRHALDRDELYVCYQPQLDMRSGQIIGAEALMRWKHRELGEISPGRFIPIAESSGLIVELSGWLLRSVCGQNKRWQEEGMDPVRVSANLSAVDFKQQDLDRLVAAALETTGLDARWLELEITESMAMAGGDDTKRILDSLKQLGVHLAIDDFGTGFSSLNRLKHFPVDRLKIDQSFVRDMTTDRSDAAISAAVIRLGHTLNLRVIAEGVEAVDQINALAEQGCDEMQGYFLSPPLQADKFAQFMADHQPTAFQFGVAAVAGKDQNVDALARWRQTG